MNVNVTKTIPIEFKWVVEAYGKVRQGGKATGIDNESWKEFELNTEKNLYVIWNRLASGSYHPQAVREVEIPKKDGTMRKLGIPTLRDRIAQQVVKEYMEKRIDKDFHENSYGYRPLKSALQAIEAVVSNCSQSDWVIDMDITKFFDEIDHEIMLKAVAHVMPEKWVSLYVKRWLEMPVQGVDGTIIAKQGKGTPQGGVISPLLANLYLHFTLDKWLEREFAHISFVRYADDVVIHCKTKAEAELVLQAIRERLGQVKLSIKESKTKIAYCKDYKRRLTHEHVNFEFLGFNFKPTKQPSKYRDRYYTSFSPDISSDNQKRITEIIRTEHAFKNTTIEITEIALRLNPKIRGWINYYGKRGKRGLYKVMSGLDQRLIKWLRKKYKLQKLKAWAKLIKIKQTNPRMFYHWQQGIC